MMISFHFLTRLLYGIGLQGVQFKYKMCYNKSCYIKLTCSTTDL